MGKTVQTQVNEMQLVREKVYAMEQNHMTLKQKYVSLSSFCLFPMRAH